MENVRIDIDDPNSPGLKKIEKWIAEENGESDCDQEIAVAIFERESTVEDFVQGTRTVVLYSIFQKGNCIDGISRHGVILGAKREEGRTSINVQRFIGKDVWFTVEPYVLEGGTLVKEKLGPETRMLYRLKKSGILVSVKQPQDGNERA